MSYRHFLARLMGTAPLLNFLLDIVLQSIWYCIDDQYDNSLNLLVILYVYDFAYTFISIRTFCRMCTHDNVQRTYNVRVTCFKRIL